MKISGKKIKELRIQKGISQVDMANVAEISRSAYIAFENKDSDTISLKSAIGISQKLEISLYDLFEIETPGTGTSEASAELEQLREKVKELEFQLEMKDYVIDSQKAIRTNFIAELVNYIEIKSVKTPYWLIKQGYKYAKNNEERAIIEKQIEKYEKERKGIYRNFIMKGLITQKELDWHLNELNTTYENQELEELFNFYFGR